MRVASVMTSDERGGAEYANVDLLGALATRGARSVLITNQPDVTQGVRVRVHVIDLGAKLSRRTVRRVTLATPRNLIRLARALFAEGPLDATLVHFKKEQLLSALLPRRLTGRLVWAEWGPLPSEFRSGPARLAYVAAARRAARILAVGESTARTLIDAGVPIERVEVVPGLADIQMIERDLAARAAQRAEWGANLTTFVIGCMTRLQGKKRTDVVVDALAYLDGEVLLVIAGDGEQEAALRERAAPYGERVRFVSAPRGWADRMLSACDVFAYAPSPTEADRPRSLVMAQLAGLPVVATAPEGARNLAADAAGAVAAPPNDPRAYAALLRLYRDDPERGWREGGAGRAAALARHDPERTLERVEAALAGTVVAPRGRGD
jgi:glycosyltransferase involved in cell wall biosynthesis